MIDNKTIVAIIPARGGSKGIPRKNLRKLAGISLLAWTIETAKASKLIDRVIVSSEDQEIIAEAKRFGADVPFIRPKELAEDHTPGVDPVLHAIQNIEPYDFVVLLQVTSPLRTTEDIDNCIKHCYQQNAPSLVSVTTPSKHPYWMFTINDSERLQPLFDQELPVRRQDLPPVYIPNGAVYLAQTNWLLKNKKFISHETAAYFMSNDNSLDIDTELDLFILEAIWMNRINLKNNNKEPVE